MHWIALFVTCALAAPAVAAPVDRRVDEHSYAEPGRVRVTRLALDLRADFAAKQLAGTATLTLAWTGAPERLILDTRDLQIDKVEGGDGKAWAPLKFTLGKRDAILGSPLTIAAGRAWPQVRVAYRTKPEASGLQWLPPALTADGKQPMLFSQSQAIHARSWVPLQDTPGVRFTYTARIGAPKELIALMSANNDPNAVRDGDYSFEMPQAIPSYLMAIAIGDLVFKPISGRAGVWAERTVVERAATEFGDLEKMIVATEKLYGPYRWGRYDLLILPPSFPFGGMENPRLSFITPTVLVGDKSLVDVVAHELAHSWSGNLVTSATWKDMWLNEGFTTYVEGRVTEAVYGRERAELTAVLSQRELTERVKEVPKDLQRLRIGSLAGQNPDETSSEVAYTKGRWFLVTLEQRFGRAAFDAFLRKWFDGHAFQSATTDDFVAALRADLMKAQPKALSDAELAAWIDGDGIPPSAVPVVSKRLVAVDAARAAWLGKGAQLASLGAAQWTTYERVHFLEGLPQTLPRAQLAVLDKALALTGTRNGEIAERWYPLTVRSGYTEARPAIAAFLEKVGRRKLVVPIYRALMAKPDGRKFARETFQRAKPSYHSITAASVEALLAVQPDERKPAGH